MKRIKQFMKRIKQFSFVKRIIISIIIALLYVGAVIALMEYGGWLADQPTPVLQKAGWIFQFISGLAIGFGILLLPYKLLMPFVREKRAATCQKKQCEEDQETEKV